MQDQITTHPHRNETVNILGVHVGTQTLSELIESISEVIETGDRAIFEYINIHAINLAQQYSWFKDFLNNTAVTYCDGVGVKMAARWLGDPIPERFTPPDWLPHLASICTKRGYSMALLGARPGVAGKAADFLIEDNPELRILGVQHGYFDKTPRGVENENIIETIKALQANILIIGFGMPLQEKWLMDNWTRLNCSVALPVGAAFDYLAGYTPRAPRWITDHGLEWLGRMFVEPKRLGRRYISGIPSFYYHVLLQRIGRYQQD